MRRISENLQLLWLAITLNAIPHGVMGGDSPPVPSSPAPPMHPSASANKDASAHFTALKPPTSTLAVLPQPPGISPDTLKGAWEGKACECFLVGQAWEQVGDYSKAAKWYRLSAQQGYALAQANLAMLYEYNRVNPDSALIHKPWLLLPDGSKVEANDLTLLDLRWPLQHELNQARAKAQAVRVKQLGDRWNHLQENLTEAIHWYHQAVQQGHTDAQYNLGRIYLRLAQDQHRQFSAVPPPAFYHQGKPDDLTTRWTKDAEDSNTEAQYQLGLMYFHGVTGTPNLIRTARLWQAAANQQHRAAEHALAWLEAKGIGVALDTESATRRYRQLAYHFLEAAGKQGVRDAWLALGHLHLELATDPKRQQQFDAKPEDVANEATRPMLPADNLDYSGARLMFEHAAKPFKHTVSADSNDATAIASEYGLPYDWLETANPGINLHNLTADQVLHIPGSPDAMLALGKLALEGAGQPRDETLAAKWFMRAIPYNQPDAHYLLGYLYQNGLGIKKQDLSQARAHYEEAARKNHARAQYNLGLLYYKGMRTGSLEPGTPPARRLHMNYDNPHKPLLINLLRELQFVNPQLIKSGTVQYVPGPNHPQEVLLVESPNANSLAILNTLNQAFPKANFQLAAPIEMPRDPLRHNYVSANEQRTESNQRAWLWWRLSELNKLEEGRLGREFLEKFIRHSQLKEAELMANRQHQTLIQISQPRKQRLTISPQSFDPVGWAAGFMIAADGYLITSRDMVTMGKRLRVVTESGAMFTARMVDATGIPNGVALLKIDGNYRFRPMPFAPSHTLHEQEEVYVVGFKSINKAAEPEACSILTHVEDTLGNQADSRFLTLTENVLGDRLFLRFNKYTDPRRTPASSKHFEGQAAMEKRALEAIAATMIAYNENLPRSQAYGYRLAQELWHDPITGQWHESQRGTDNLHFTKGKFVVVDGKLVRTPPPADKLENRGLPLLRILAPSGLALHAERVLRKTFWESGFERDSFQPGLRGMALLNQHGQAVAIHYPPLRLDADHDYPNFNTYDRFALKADALVSALRQRSELRLDEAQPIEAKIAPALRLNGEPYSGLESFRPGAWTPPSTRFSLGAHTHSDPLVRTNLNACNLALECIDSPMLSRARASLVLVQVAE